MNDAGVLMKNEQDANRLSAKIMLISIAFLVAVYIMELLGIFIDDIKKVTFAFSIALVLLILPWMAVFVLKLNGRWVKYAMVTVAGFILALINMIMSKDVVLLYIFAVAIASLYFSKALSWYAVIYSVVILTASQITATHFRMFSDLNYADKWFFAVVPRDIELVILSLIYITLAGRTKKLLENSIGADQQKEMLDRLSSIKDKSMDVTNVLAGSLNQLSDITEHTKTANEQIAENTGKIATGSEDTLKYVDSASAASESMSHDLDNIADECRSIADISKQVNRLTEDSVAMMKEADAEMKAIRETTEKSRLIINNLGDRSNEIGRIVEIITAIAEQTNLLALNAAIESARAGEHGKGFAVVSEEIRKLAEQSQGSARDISVLIKKVLGETDDAVLIIDNNSKTVDKGLTKISSAGTAVDRVSVASREVNLKIQEISDFTQKIAEQGGKIVEFVKNIKDINRASIKELQYIASAASQQLAGMQQVASSVDSIRDISRELLQVVSE